MEFFSRTQLDAAFEPLPNQRFRAVYLAPGPPGLSCLWCRDSQVAGCRYDAMESLVALALSGVQVVQKNHPMKSAGVAGRLVRAPGSGRASSWGRRELDLQRN